MNKINDNKKPELDKSEGRSNRLETIVSLRAGILCPFCGKKPKEYQGAHTDGEGNKIWDEMIQCQTLGCAVWGHCFIRKKWLIRAEQSN